MLSITMNGSNDPLIFSGNDNQIQYRTLLNCISHMCHGQFIYGTLLSTEEKYNEIIKQIVITVYVYKHNEILQAIHLHFLDR